MPFVEPDDVPVEPPPASVVTTPLGVTRRTLWFNESHTNTVLLASTALACGVKKSAEVPVPSVDPDVEPEAPPPASVVTTHCNCAATTRRETKQTAATRHERLTGMLPSRGCQTAAVRETENSTTQHPE